MNKRDFDELFQRKYQEEKNKLEKPNLMIVGGSGVGKSSLINKIFGKEIAKVGNGEPITKGVHKYFTQEVPLVIYDTEGYEISQNGIDNSNFEIEVLSKLREMQGKSLTDQIHLVWYCISIANHRITNYDISNIKKLQKIFGEKIAMVLTQCDLDNKLGNGKGERAEEFKKIVRKEIGDLKVFEVSIEKELELDLEKLMKYSIEELPNERLKEAFIEAQNIDISIKEKKCYKLATGYALTSAVTGGFSIPISDAPLIVAQQMAMVFHITNIFGYGKYKGLIKKLVGGQIVTFAGKQLVVSLTKIIPGFGNIISGVVAGSITFAIGSALTKMYTEVTKKYLKTGEVPNFEEFFENGMFEKFVEEGLKQWKQKR